MEQTKIQYTPQSLAAKAPENDGWKTNYFPFGMVIFQGRTVKLPGGRSSFPQLLTPPKTNISPGKKDISNGNYSSNHYFSGD